MSHKAKMFTLIPYTIPRSTFRCNLNYIKIWISIFFHDIWNIRVPVGCSFKLCFCNKTTIDSIVSSLVIFKWKSNSNHWLCEHFSRTLMYAMQMQIVLNHSELISQIIMSHTVCQTNRQTQMPPASWSGNGQHIIPDE